MAGVKDQFKLILNICLVMVAIHSANIFLNGNLNQFGILPGNVNSLPYILTAPWLHGSWGHLINNLIGMAVFSSLCLIRGIPFFVRSSTIIVVLTGLLVWFFGRSNAVHIGASGWIFGLWSLSIAIAWFQRSFLNIVIAIFVAFFYGGMIWGVMPTDPYISFESHFFGAFSGIVAAYMMTRGNKSLSKRSN
ncbi:rhomboid family intramembrane serine protease [Agarilytica rhodophyticola]|uniref:rhomboid family intramembrane serine protease n=1 Tax=Agarilytica rhodophyticola TaxID=1737490 RepID=UPI000B346111|nr:rhomboid family intramembrane serine protease [Agarilytica rhodophyticola]